MKYIWPFARSEGYVKHGIWLLEREIGVQAM